MRASIIRHTAEVFKPDLFIVDNSDTDWKVKSYLTEWCELSKRDKGAKHGPGFRAIKTAPVSVMFCSFCLPLSPQLSTHAHTDTET